MRGNTPQLGAVWDEKSHALNMLRRMESTTILKKDRAISD
jgi:hypothetical protein